MRILPSFAMKSFFDSLFPCALSGKVFENGVVEAIGLS